MRISKGVLGKLYRDINNQKALAQYLKNEYMYSIRNMHEINMKIVQKLVENVGSSYPQMHYYLIGIYSDIVLPMERSLKEIMLAF